MCTSRKRAGRGKEHRDSETRRRWRADASAPAYGLPALTKRPALNLRPLPTASKHPAQQCGSPERDRGDVMRKNDATQSSPHHRFLAFTAPAHEAPPIVVQPCKSKAHGRWGGQGERRPIVDAGTESGSPVRGARSLSATQNTGTRWVASLVDKGLMGDGAPAGRWQNYVALVQNARGCCHALAPPLGVLRHSVIAVVCGSRWGWVG